MLGYTDEGTAEGAL